MLESGTETLIIECGVHMSAIKQALDFDLSNVVGVLVTHEHKDHCKAVKDVISAGMNVYASVGTINAFGIKSHRLFPLQAGNNDQYPSFVLGGFKIKPFDAVHDCAEPINFLIEHEDMGRMVFITDSYYCHYTFPGLHNIIIEANFSQEILDRKVKAGESPEFLRNRVLQSHMSLATCKEFLQANDLSLVNNIMLIHLSNSNSNAKQFEAEIRNLTAKNVHIADKGLIINFNKEPF